ncbi:hypothetical protein [Streptomyces nitrosporeus]|uniref:hypothetical protein n=1 Tax=Streptomyces nitrosporeus TaxID=28894 RepID=UPI0039A06750
MSITIPGALADYLTAQRIADADTVTALDGARRSRGRTLLIEPTSTRVLHIISAYAEALLQNRALHTTAEVRAARLWIQRAGHAPDTVTVRTAPTVTDRAAAELESRQMAELITEAEATDGTWRGQWIGDTTALFDRPTEQGAFF